MLFACSGKDDRGDDGAADGTGDTGQSVEDTDTDTDITYMDDRPQQLCVDIIHHDRASLGLPSYDRRVDGVEGLARVWAEGPGTDLSLHGPYVNMSSTTYTEVACGLNGTPSGQVCAIQNVR